MNGEFALITRHFTRPGRAVHAGVPTGHTPNDGRVELGVGDDCALLAPAAGQRLAVTSDMLIEGRHFLSTVAPHKLGHKALAVNLSDLAACGAQPLGFTLALALPRVDDDFLAGFASGLFALADAHGIELVGGDTTAGPLAICITAFGQVPPGQALLRSGARPGDELWVSGRLGDARLALEVFRGQVALGHAGSAGDTGDGEVGLAADFDTVRCAMEMPQPRVALGMALRAVASSAIDLSDGLVGDLGHVLSRSGVGATVNADALPRSNALARQPVALQRNCVLAGGDDYELLFTAPPGMHAAVRAAAQQAGVQVTPIGHIQREPGLRIVDDQQRPVVGSWQGFDHFGS